MKKLAFISRHVPTAAQIEIARKVDVEIVHVGDRDAFTVNCEEFENHDGVIVVHPAAALRFSCKADWIGIFENANRAPEGKPVQFEPVKLHLFRIREEGCDQYCLAWPHIEQNGEIL